MNMKTPPRIIIKQISQVRARNNRLWMELLEIAVTKSPRRAKALLRGIKGNDELISKLTGKLSR